MTIDVEALQNTDFDANEALETYNSMSKPIPAGKYNLTLAELVDFIAGEKYISFTVHFRILDGEFANRQIRFQRLSSFQIFALIEAAGLELDPKKINATEIYKALTKIQEGEIPFSAYVDWEVYSTPVRNATLMKLTGTKNLNDAKDAARGNNDIWNAANEAALLAKTTKDFPVDEDGDPVPFVQDPETGEQRDARPTIKKFFPVSK